MAPTPLGLTAYREPAEPEKLLRATSPPDLRGLAAAPAMPQTSHWAEAQALAEANAQAALWRTRMRTLRPMRPLKLARLLAMPLEPVLIDAAHWRSDAVTLPRSAIQPFAAVIEAALPEVTDNVSAMIAGKTTKDSEAVHQAGAVLWPAAATVLQAATVPPPDWARACLPPASFQPLAQAVAVCLSVSTRLPDLADPTMPAAHLDTALSAILRLALPVQPLGWRMMLALLVTQFPGAQPLRDAMLHQGAATQLRPASDAVLRHVWAWIDEALTGAPAELADMAAALRRRTVMLHALAGERAHRELATEKRAALRQVYAAQLASLVRERLIAPLAGLTAAPDDAQAASLEAEARGLRRLAADIRALGGQADTVMQDAAGVVAHMGVLEVVDRARLVEILDDPELALRLLEGR
jgi:hypothetical protein